MLCFTFNLTLSLPRSVVACYLFIYFSILFRMQNAVKGKNMQVKWVIPTQSHLCNKMTLLSIAYADLWVCVSVFFFFFKWKCVISISDAVKWFVYIVYSVNVSPFSIRNEATKSNCRIWKQYWLLFTFGYNITNTNIGWTVAESVFEKQKEREREKSRNKNRSRNSMLVVHGFCFWLASVIFCCINSILAIEPLPTSDACENSDSQFCGTW